MKRKKSNREKQFKERNGWKFPRFDEKNVCLGTQKSQPQGGQTQKRTVPQHIIVNLLEPKDKEIPESCKRKMTHYIQRTILFADFS